MKEKIILQWVGTAEIHNWSSSQEQVAAAVAQWPQNTAMNEKKIHTSVLLPPMLKNSGRRKDIRM